MAFLTGVQWCLTAVLIAFLIISHIEHLFMALLPICMSSLEKCLFRSSVHFFIGLFKFFHCCYSVSWAVCILWKLSSVSHIISKYFLPFNRLSFGLFMVSFVVQVLISLITSHFFTFAFISIAFIDWPKKILVWFMSENVLPNFSAKNFMVSSHILSHFEFILRMFSKFIDLHTAVQFPNTSFWRDCIFSISYTCLFCWKLIDHWCLGLWKYHFWKTFLCCL